MKSTQKGGENNENYENNEKCGVYSGHYAADGETVIGSFTVDNSNVCANSF